MPMIASVFPLSWFRWQPVRPITDTIVPAIPTRPQKLSKRDIPDMTKPTMHIVLNGAFFVVAFTGSEQASACKVGDENAAPRCAAPHSEQKAELL